MRFPRNLFEWSRTFKDDLGYEPMGVGSPTEATPGSPDKIAILRERVERGQRLWRDGDHSVMDDTPPIEWNYAGSESYGAVVGKDREGNKHRYAIWTELGTRESPQAKRVLYVTATASYSDSFDKDPELSAIRRHAKLIGAEFVAVAPLFSARCHNERELAGRSEPFTELGLQWIRWFTRQVGRVVACWGETPQLERHVDVLWMLKRTSRNCQVYSLDESADWPPQVNRMSEATIHKYDFQSIVAEREALERDEDDDDGFAAC